MPAREPGGVILVGTPCYTGSVSVPYLTSLLAMERHCHQVGIDIELQHITGESLLPRARNLIANTFLRRHEFSHLLLIDPDIGFPADALERYLRSGREVVCGLPPAPRLDIARLCALPAGLSAAEAEAAALSYPYTPCPGAVVGPDGLLPALAAPAAFMLLGRRVLRRLAQASPELRYRQSYVDSGDAMFKKWAFFHPGVDPDTRQALSDDAAFCRRWIALGGTIDADTIGRFTRTGLYAATGAAAAQQTLGRGSLRG